MQLHQLKHKRKQKKRVGRGGKRGTYCGKGMKGQKARAGAKTAPPMRELIKKYHKLRGYRFKTLSLKNMIVNLATLEKSFESGATVNPEVLLEKKIIRRIKGKKPFVKILGQGELTKKLIIANCQVSRGAREKIEKAGGTIK